VRKDLEIEIEMAVMEKLRVFTVQEVVSLLALVSIWTLILSIISCKNLDY